MSSLPARTGRHRQRYENNFRLVAGCIPYRLRKDVEDDDVENNLENLEVCMISSPNRHDLVFPKGGWENDETVCEAACREALEEAGVKGRVNENPLGVWLFRSKSNQDRCSLEGQCKGFMFALEVTEEFDAWPEEDNHRRRWLTVEEAFSLCRYEWMQSALKVFIRGIEAEKFQTTEELEEPAELPAEEVIPDHQLLSSCFLTPSSNQRLDEPYKFDDLFKCSVLG